jgi:A/G-specific adenine glycosylase
MAASPPQPALSAATLARVRGALLGWYADAHRDFPWRRTTDPWAVLVSEVMLQQTQASRVAERFGPLLERFPTPSAMAAAGEAQVLSAWSGLGYNRRALALRRAAHHIARDGWPREPAALEQLPGIGPYTARAVAALAFGQPVGVVDTNVRRWLVRRFGLPTTAAPGRLQELADGLASGAQDGAEAATWVHASMEFGAAVCSARAPACERCPIRRGCPSRGRAVHVPVARQPAFAGSDRSHRGAILKQLAAAPGHALPVAAVRAGLDGDLARLLDGLERDGLAHRSGELVRLGGRRDGSAPSTIGP